MNAQDSERRPLGTISPHAMLQYLDSSPSLNSRYSVGPLTDAPGVGEYEFRSFQRWAYRGEDSFHGNMANLHRTICERSLCDGYGFYLICPNAVQGAVARAGLDVFKAAQEHHDNRQEPLILFGHVVDGSLHRDLTWCQDPALMYANEAWPRTGDLASIRSATLYHDRVSDLYATRYSTARVRLVPTTLRPTLVILLERAHVAVTIAREGPLHRFQAQVRADLADLERRAWLQCSDDPTPSARDVLAFVRMVRGLRDLAAAMPRRASHIFSLDNLGVSPVAARTSGIQYAMHMHHEDARLVNQFWEDFSHEEH